MPTNVRINRRMVLAEHFGCDYADLDDTRYQPSRFVKIPVWVDGDDFYCVTRPGESPPLKRDGGHGDAFSVKWVDQGRCWPLTKSTYAHLTIWRAM
jgi:hypothetical protein